MGKKTEINTKMLRLVEFLYVLKLCLIEHVELYTNI